MRLTPPVLCAAFCVFVSPFARGQVPVALEATPSPTPLSAASAPATLQRTELFFGGIAATSWNEFLADTVSPRFPDGFTWFDSHGQWQTPKGEIGRQDSRVLVILHASTVEKDRLIEEVREQFKQRFHEMSVLRADAPVRASF